MRKYMSIFNSSHEKLIEFINIYYTRRGWRIISIVKGNGDFWATLELETEKNNDKKERERQIKKAYIFYRRRVRTLLATGRYLLTIDYRKKDINNEK